MRRRSFVGMMTLLALAACSKGADRPAADTTAMADSAPAGPMAFVTVIYNQPKDAAAFEQYYWDTHVPLVERNQNEIGFVAAELTRFEGTLDGKPSPYYRQAVLWFKSLADLEKGIATPGFKAVGDDLANFATGGLVGLVGEETGEQSALSSEDSTAFVTVIYNHPKDHSAFENYYQATHLPLVGQNAAEIGFSRAELTRFNRNLDGTSAAFYRQAKLYFPSPEARSKALATPGFKAVGDDLANFASGGLVGLVGRVTRGK